MTAKPTATDLVCAGFSERDHGEWIQIVYVVRLRHPSGSASLDTTVAEFAVGREPSDANCLRQQHAADRLAAAVAQWLRDCGAAS